MPIYSLLCPTRGRIHSINRLLESLQFTTHSKGDVELLFAVDDNDIPTKEHIQQIINSQQYNPLTIKLCLRQQSEMLNRDYYNWLATQAQGQFLWVIGDDVVFQVVSWDTKILTKLSEYLKDKSDKIFCAGIRDSTPKPKPELPMFPCFPLVSMEAFKALGFVLHPNIPTWGADYLIYLLYVGVNRYITIEDEVYLHHIGIHTHTGPKDDTATRVEQIYARNKNNPEFSIDYHKDHRIPQEIENFKQLIEKIRQGQI